MKKTSTLCFIALLGTLSLPCMAEQTKPDALQTEARQLSKTLGQQLKTTLVAAIKSGGPIQAISACNLQAPVIAADVSEQAGWQVGRTALKIRNPNNAPDDWEQAVLEAFETRLAAGEPVQNLEFAEVIEDQGTSEYRYMKAIPTAQPCLTCHGENLAQPVLDQLKTLYPDDQATGFKLNDLRGAFTLRKPL